MGFIGGFFAGTLAGIFIGVFMAAIMAEAGRQRREKELREDYEKMGRGGTD